MCIRDRSYGGPSYYIENALGSRGIGVLFAVALIATYAVGFNMLASFNLQDSFRVYDFYVPGKTSWMIGAVPVSYTHLDVYKRQG